MGGGTFFFTVMLSCHALPASSATSFPFLGVQLLGYFEKFLGSFDAEMFEGKGLRVGGYGKGRAKLAVIPL